MSRLRLHRRLAYLPLLLCCPAARAGVIKGQVILPPQATTAAEQPLVPPPLGYWRIENAIVPPMPAPEVRGPVVIVLEPPKMPESTPEPVVLEAKPLRLEPRVAVGQLGAVVAIRNLDKTTRTLFLKDGDLFMPRQATAPGAVREVKFTEPGDYVIADADHPHGSAIVLIVRTPYSTRADDKGAFHIEVPEGKYILKAWWAGTWYDSQEVEVGRSTREVVVKLAEKAPLPPRAREKK